MTAHADRQDRRPLRIGVVGAGEVVRSLHLPVLTSFGDVEVRWICDRNVEVAKAAARTFGVHTACAVLDDRTAEADIVLVSTPVAARREVLGRIIGRGQHAFCEKPFAASLEDHRWLLAEARDAGVRLGVALVRRVYGSTRLAQRLVASGVLGTVLSVSASEGSRVQRTGRESDWYQANAAESNGGVLMEIGPHLVDQVFTICDVRAWSIATCEQVSCDGLDFETTVQGTLELGSGERAPFRFDISRLNDVYNGIVIRGEHAELRIGITPEIGVEIAGRRDAAPARLDAPGPRDTYAAFCAEWREFISRCRLDGDAAEDTGLLTTALIDACYARARPRAKTPAPGQ